MKKQAVTLETISDVLVIMQGDIKSIKTDVGTLKTDVGTLKSDVGTLKHEMSSIQESVEFLVEHAVMKEDVRQIVREEIYPIRTELFSAMDVIIGNNQKFEGESLALRHHHDLLDHRVRIIEQKIGLPKAA
ncbi:MAG: hypothetical protein AAB664_00740 [Patescibacteria group bacterium]